MVVFEAWSDGEDITFSTSENIKNMIDKGLLPQEAKMLYQIEASSYEEAMTLHHQKMGWEPYSPTK